MPANSLGVIDATAYLRRLAVALKGIAASRAAVEAITQQIEGRPADQPAATAASSPSAVQGCVSELVSADK